MNSNGYANKSELESIALEIKEAEFNLNKSPFDFEALRFSLDKPVHAPCPIITTCEEIISTPGNITTISGPSKGGKSAVGGATMAGSIAPKGIIVDTLGLDVTYNSNHLAALHFDTEQSDYNHDRFCRSVYKRACRGSDVDNFRSFSVRRFDYETRKRFIEDACSNYAYKHNGIFILLIDGIADLLKKGPNDEDESIALVNWTENLAITFNCPAIVMLHVNPGSEKERGHIGSQLQRKSESVLSVSKTAGTNQSNIQGKLLRNAGEIPEIVFEYDKAKGYHALVSKTSQDHKREKKEFQKRNEEQGKIDQIRFDFEAIIGASKMRNKDLIAAYMSFTGLGQRSADGNWSKVKHFFNNTNGEYHCK